MKFKNQEEKSQRKADISAKFLNGLIQLKENQVKYSLEALCEFSGLKKYLISCNGRIQHTPEYKEPLGLLTVSVKLTNTDYLRKVIVINTETLLIKEVLND